MMIEKMKQKTYILFDLDGTLTDPMEGITKSAQYALKHYGIIVLDHKDLSFFIGPPLKDTFIERYAFSPEKAEEAVHVFREYFIPKGIFENKIYPGIPELLKELSEAGKRLIVATSKPWKFAEQILEYFHIRKYFDFVAGSTMEHEKRSRKSEVIAYAMEQNEIADIEDVVMVGDRKYDVEGARELGIASVGVMFGYGSRQELEEARADVLVESVSSLRKSLL